jgi:hypothetical protein
MLVDAMLTQLSSIMSSRQMAYRQFYFGTT